MLIAITVLVETAFNLLLCSLLLLFVFVLSLLLQSTHALASFLHVQFSPRLSLKVSVSLLLRAAEISSLARVCTSGG